MKMNFTIIKGHYININNIAWFKPLNDKSIEIQFTTEGSLVITFDNTSIHDQELRRLHAIVFNL